MNLILQGNSAPRHLVEQVAALARPRAIVAIGEHAYRCEEVTYNDEVKAQIDLAAWASQLDYAFLEGRRALGDFGLLAMDMDSTLINIECIDEIAGVVGVKDKVSEITEAAMRGEIKDFAESLRRRVALLNGAPAGALDQVYEEKLRLNPGAERLISTAQAAGIKVLLVSGGFTFFTERLRARLNLDSAHANTLEIEDGVLTGRVLGDILDADAKAAHLRDFARTHGASTEQIIAMGDGANDLKMLANAGFPVAYHAKPLVRQQTRYALNVSGLDGVLNWFES